MLSRRKTWLLGEQSLRSESELVRKSVLVKEPRSFAELSESVSGKRQSRLQSVSLSWRQSFMPSLRLTGMP